MKKVYFTALGLIVATLYLQAFWSEVNINPFPYIAPSQYFAYTVGGFSGIVISFLLGSAFSGLTKKFKEPPGEVQFSWRQEWYVIVFLAACLLFGLASLPLFLMGAVGLLGLFASFRLANSKTYQALHEDIEIRRLLIFAFFLLPPFSMFAGQSEAHRRIYFDIQEVRWVGSKEHQELIGSTYFGRLGDVLVFIDEEEKRRFLVPSSKLEGFSFTQETEPADGGND